MTLVPYEFNLHKELGKIARTLALRSHQKGLELLLDIAKDVPEAVFADGLRLSQVLLNLLENSIKFTGSARRRYGGSGLGLAISTSLSELWAEG